MTLGDVRSHPDQPRLARLVRRVVDEGHARPWQGAAYRCASQRYAEEVPFLSGEGTQRFGSRWMAPGVTRALHAATTAEVALQESLAQSRRYGLPPWRAMPLVIRGVKVRVSRLLDLTDGQLRRRFQVAEKRLLAQDWEAKNRDLRAETISQALGRAAYEGEVEALLVPSAAVPSAHTLVVFPERLGPLSELTVLPPTSPGR